MQTVAIYASTARYDRMDDVDAIHGRDRQTIVRSTFPILVGKEGEERKKFLRISRPRIRMRSVKWYSASSHDHNYCQNSNVITCVSVRCRELENSARSAILRYCFSLNFFSRLRSCCVVNGVLGFRFGLCFLRLHFNFGVSPLFESANIFKRHKLKIIHGNMVLL